MSNKNRNITYSEYIKLCRKDVHLNLFVAVIIQKKYISHHIFLNATLES